MGVEMKKNLDFTFIQDTPIKNEKEDILNYSIFAERLANALLSIPADGKFVFALCGEWGSGKTSILNLTETKLSKRNFVIIHFSPWNITDKNILLKEFFSTLKNKLPIEKEKSRLYKLIDRYQDLLINETQNIPSIGKWISTLFNICIQLFVREKRDDSITVQKELIINYLQKEKISKKIIIMMDDLDRLTQDEIQLVFRLIKEIADFPKISYVLSFDKTQVTNAIQNLQNCDGAEYLKKFINLQWNVPVPNNDKLFEVLKNQLENNNIILPDYQEIVYFEKTYKTCIAPFIKNIRDIKLLCNSFVFSYKIIGEEINISDLLSITACSIFYPKLFSYIRENKGLLTGLDNSYYLTHYMKTLGGGINNSNTANEFLNSLKNNFSDTETDFELAKTIIFFLFPLYAKLCDETPGSNEKEIDSRNLIQSKLSFSKYFKQALNETDVSMKEVKYFLEKSNQEEAITYLKKLSNQEISYSNFLSIIEEKVLNQKTERLKIISTSLLICAENIEGYEQNSSGFCFSLFRKTLNLCTTILYKFGKKETYNLLSSLIESQIFFDCYKSLCNILINNYHAFSRKDDNYQAMEEKDFETICSSFFTKLQTNISNIELIDDLGKADIFFLYHFKNREFLKENFKDYFNNPKKSLQLILSLSGTWFTKTDREISANDLWKSEMPEIEVLHDNEKLINNILISPVYKSLDLKEKEELARYCSNFSIATEGCYSSNDILIAWENKYNKI